jgi:Fungal Zn(2)-Cys(6) binuclear cluster domain
MEPRKIRRPAVVCRECRRRKIKCDRGHPCAQCSESLLHCSYTRPFSASSHPAPAYRSHDATSSASAASMPAHSGMIAGWSEWSESSSTDSTNAVPLPTPTSSSALSDIIPSSTSRRAGPEIASAGPASPAGLGVRLINGEYNDRPHHWRAVLSQACIFFKSNVFLSL